MNGNISSVGAGETDDFGKGIKMIDMPQQSEVREPEEDWTGLNDPKTRRKLQNRLNQRLWRRRQRERNLNSHLNLGTKKISSNDPPGSEPTSSHAASPSVHNFMTVNHASEATPTKQLSEIDEVVELSRPPQFSISLCRTTPSDIQQNMSRFEEWVHKNYFMGSPRVDQLLTLIQFNVFRALFSNTSSIGFDLEWLLNGEAISPFNTAEYDETSNSMPESLRPTQLQRTVEHHPWIDLFPLPGMRENLLLAGEDFDDTDICMDIVEIGDKPREEVGLIIWGEPWDPYAWEASPAFLQKWAWAVKGCHTIIKSTNYWRMQRGESPLHVNSVESQISMASTKIVIEA